MGSRTLEKGLTARVLLCRERRPLRLNRQIPQRENKHIAAIEEKTHTRQHRLLPVALLLCSLPAVGMYRQDGHPWMENARGRMRHGQEIVCVKR